MMRILTNEFQSNLVLLVRSKSDDETKNRIKMIMKKMITIEDIEQLHSWTIITKTCMFR